MSSVKKVVKFGATQETNQPYLRPDVKDSSSADLRRAPRPQPWYSYNSSAWEVAPAQPILENHLNGSHSMPSRLRLLTWSIDVLEGGSQIRMASAITYLANLLAISPPNIPIVIFLQEICSSDLDLLKGTKWVQDRFFMTDIDEHHWNEPRYGTTTLLDRRLPISAVFRVFFKSQFGRDGLFVDISATDQGAATETPLRLCNTHLESLICVPPLRPEQMALAAYYLHADDVRAGVLAGDLNAIQPFDLTLHADNALEDAYLANGGEEGGADGFTWGFQSSEESMRRFGPSRMDKVLYCGQIAVHGLQRIGLGARVEEAARAEVRDLCEGREWITDHYGLSVYMDLLP